MTKKKEQAKKVADETGVDAKSLERLSTADLAKLDALTPDDDLLLGAAPQELPELGQPDLDSKKEYVLPVARIDESRILSVPTEEPKADSKDKKLPVEPKDESKDVGAHDVLLGYHPISNEPIYK